MTDDDDQVVSMVCLHCQEPLNRFRLFGSSTVTWTHGRAVDYDHHPEPVPSREMLTVNRMCDFCCSHATVEWRYDTAEETTHTVLSPAYSNRIIAQTTQSPHWAACGPCAEFIERRDLDGLATYVCTVSPKFIVVPRSSLIDFYGMFITARKSGRTRVSPAPKPHRTTGEHQT